jgi:hypothetical protein
MEVLDEPLGSDMQVLMNICQHPESRQQNKHSFRGFKDGYDPKAALYLFAFHGISPRADQLTRLSRLRYWIASERCSVAIFSFPSISAIVLATFRMRL